MYFKEFFAKIKKRVYIEDSSEKNIEKVEVILKYDSGDDVFNNSNYNEDLDAVPNVSAETLHAEDVDKYDIKEFNLNENDHKSKKPILDSESLIRKVNEDFNTEEIQKDDKKGFDSVSLICKEVQTK
jgi:hypothetical protein